VRGLAARGPRKHVRSERHERCRERHGRYAVPAPATPTGRAAVLWTTRRQRNECRATRPGSTPGVTSPDDRSAAGGRGRSSATSDRGRCCVGSCWYCRL
jgi:hypothetical protein